MIIHLYILVKNVNFMSKKKRNKQNHGILKGIMRKGVTYELLCDGYWWNIYQIYGYGC